MINFYMKKEKLATQDKSRKCSHDLCRNPVVTEIPIGLEKRKVCQDHYNQWTRQFQETPKVEFIKSSKIGITENGIRINSEIVQRNILNQGIILGKIIDNNKY